MRLRLLLFFVLVSVALGQRGGAGGGTQAQGQGGAAGGQGAGGRQGGNLTPQVTDPKLLCSIEGRTVNALTGDPIPRASLSLVGPSGGGGGRGLAGSRAARSDNEGKFLIDRIQPGTYRLTAERVGFLRQSYGARTPGGTGAIIALAESRNLTGIDIKLTPQGVITGMVLDDAGDPLPRSSVVAYRKGTILSLNAGRGGAQAQTAVSAMTNDIGEYRLAGLTPGEYLIVASNQGGARGGRGDMALEVGARGGRGAQAQVSQQPGAPLEALMPTYYPSTLDAAGAAPVQVTPGQDVGGITIALRRGSLYRVQGRVVGATAQDASSIRVNLIRQGGAAMMMGRGGAAAVRTDGTFEVTGVQPGSYYLIAESMGGRGGRGGGGRGGTAAGWTGRTSLDVTSGDVRNVVVTLVEPMTVSGTVKTEGQQQATEQPRLAISLNPMERIPGLPGGGGQGRVDQKGAFQIASVTPDKYYVSFSGLPEGTYVKSVRMGNQEVIDKGIDLTMASGGVTLDVTLSPKAGSIEGTVTADGTPAPGGWILMLTDPINPAQMYLNRYSTTDQDGRFTIGGLPPGDYRLYAFEESQPEIVQDLDQIKPFEQKAVKVSVTEGAASRAELKILTPADGKQQ